MPAFTFEKISPPRRLDPIAPAEKKQRGRIVQLLDRFAELRLTHALRKKHPAPRRQQEPSG